MPRIFDKVLCIKCPLDEVCPWSASEVMAIDKDGDVWIKDDAWNEGHEALAIANANCPLKKIVDAQHRGQEILV